MSPPSVSEARPVPSLSVGKTLQKERLNRGVSIEDISAKTFIKLHYLQALEQGLLEDLPAPVYTSGYIRQYARVLGLDEFQLVQLYQAERQTLDTYQSEQGEWLESTFSPVVTQSRGRVSIQTLTAFKEPEEGPQMEDTMTQQPKQVLATVSGEHKDALSIRHQTEQFADQVLAHLEDEIGKTLLVIQNGRAYLQQRLNTYSF